MRFQNFLLVIALLFSSVSNSQIDTFPQNADIIKKDALVPAKKSLETRDSLKNLDSVTDSIRLITDTSRIQDSLQNIKDSISRIAVKAPIKDPETKIGILKTFSGNEALFYYIIFLLLLFGLMRKAFPKYFSDLFRVFFQTTLKQKQVREQLLQTPLPSILMNCFFVLSAGLYINLLLKHFHLVVSENFWIQYLYCIWAIGSIYLVKYIGLQIAGWVFNVKELMNSYTFIVFIVNKMIGIYLLFFNILISFTQGNFYQISFTLSWVGTGILLVYRFILSYGVSRDMIKFNPFHFILYAFAFEIIPLLLIYKMLLMIF